MDQDKLQGTWRVVSIETGGSLVPAEVAATVRYIFNGDHVRLMEGDQSAGEGLIRLDPEANPKEFDFTATAGPQAGTTVRGIYRVEGDTLTMCLGEERPSTFSGAGPAALVELSRIR